MFSLDYIVPSRTGFASQGGHAVNIELAALRGVERGAEVDGRALDGCGGGEGRHGDDGEGGEVHFGGGGVVGEEGLVWVMFLLEVWD